jgi:hypothetical protein
MTMNPYDTRCRMLDPGLTALALRGLNEREGHYPFLDRYRGRRPARRLTKQAAHHASRWQQALRWCRLSRRSIAALTRAASA